MTALLALERAKLDDVFTAAPLRSAQAAESRIGLRAGERMRSATCCAALLLASANDAAATLAVGVAGSRAAFVRQMNARARELGLRHTHYANPIGLDEPGNYSTAARPRAARAPPARATPSCARRWTCAAPCCTSGDRVRTVVNRNDCSCAVPWVNGVKTGHTNAAGYVLVGSAQPRRRDVRQRRARRPERGRPRRRRARAAAATGFARYREVAAVHARPACSPRAPVKLPRATSASTLVAGAHACASRARAATRARVATVDAPDELEGPLPRARARRQRGDRAVAGAVGRARPARHAPSASPRSRSAERAIDCDLETGYARRDRSSSRPRRSPARRRAAPPARARRRARTPAA